MRFMIMVRATRDTEAGKQAPESLFAEMAAYHEALAKAGVLLDGSGLQPSAKGWRIRYSGDQRTVVDGPFAEAKELIAGYTLIQVKAREEAFEWARRFPNPARRPRRGGDRGPATLRARGFRAESDARALSRHQHGVAAMNGAGRSVLVGRVLSALAILFLGVDTAIKLVQLPVVGETLAELGYPSGARVDDRHRRARLPRVVRGAADGPPRRDLVDGGVRRRHREPHSRRARRLFTHISVRRLSGAVRLGRAVSTQRASPRSHPAATLTVF